MRAILKQGAGDMGREAPKKEREIICKINRTVHALVRTGGVLIPEDRAGVLLGAPAVGAHVFLLLKLLKNADDI